MKIRKLRQAVRWFVIVMIALLRVTDVSNAEEKRKVGEKEKIATYMDRLLGVAMPKQDMSVIVGAYGTVLITRDNGNHWEHKKISDLQLNDIFFINENVGWVVGEKGLIFKTTDGGENWIRQKSPVENHLFSVRFIDPEKGWTVGYGDFQGMVLFTRDGGRNWEVQYNAGDKLLYGLDFYDQNKGVLVGERGALLVTEDGGKSWVKKEVPFGNTLFNVKLESDGKGIILGMEGLILKTDDYGNSWSKIESGVEESLLDLKITDKYIFIVGARGIFLVFERQNGNFKRMSLPTKYYISSIDFFNDSGFVTGAHGTVLKFWCKESSDCDIAFEMISGTQMPVF